jgi:hypothetical protein
MAGTQARRRAASAILAVALLLSGAAQAQTPTTTEQFKQAFAQIYSLISVVDALAQQCDAQAPKSRRSRDAAIKGWREENGIDDFQDAVVPILSRIPNGALLVGVVRDKAAAKAKELLKEKPTLCETFDEVVSEKELALAGQIDDILPLLEAANKRLAAATPAQPPSSTTDLTLYTAAQLGNLAELAMNPIASAEAAAKDGKLDDAREKAGKKAVEALGIIAVRGTVVGRG